MPQEIIDGGISNGVFTIRIEKEAFLDEVRSLIDIQPIIRELDDVLKLRWPHALLPPQLFSTIPELMDLIKVVASAVEITKQKYIHTTVLPERARSVKFDKTLAIESAVSILDELVVMEGFIGKIIDKIDRPFIMALVSFWVNGQDGDWTDKAKSILGMIV